jgi:hypothetical protein
VGRGRIDQAHRDGVRARGLALAAAELPPDEWARRPWRAGDAIYVNELEEL